MATIPLAPQTARAIDPGDRRTVRRPDLSHPGGQRLDRHGAGRIVCRVACCAGITKNVGHAHAAARFARSPALHRRATRHGSHSQEIRLLMAEWLPLAGASPSEFELRASSCKREGSAVTVGSRRVIAGVSGSLRSLGALRAGVAEARSSGAPLLAVLAWAPAGGEVACRRAPCPRLLKLWEHTAQERLHEAFDTAFGGIPPDVAVRLMVVRARPGPLLVELADQPDDLLVVGHGGRSRLGWIVHGSVTRYCLAHAPCPVLAVPPPELIAELRPWPHHHWRPEDFVVTRAVAEITTCDRADAEPAAGPASRVVASPPKAPTAGAFPKSPLPRAYQGAPYYQPRRPSRTQRALRRLRAAFILVAVILLAIITGMLLAHSTFP